MNGVARALLASLALLGAGCVSAHVVPPEERSVTADPVTADWRRAAAADLPGLWRTRTIEGPAAAVLLDLTYWIGEDGHFSGAALFAGPPPAYQVLSGTWRLAEDGTLVLGDDAEPARVEVAEGLLRLTGSDGSLVFERAQLR